MVLERGLGAGPGGVGRKGSGLLGVALHLHFGLQRCVVVQGCSRRT